MDNELPALPRRCVLEERDWGARLGGSVIMHLTLDFGSGHDLRIVGYSPKLGSVLSRESARESLPLHRPLPPPTARSFYLNK